MAKKDVQDFRIDFIEAVARTDNLKILRSVCSQMEGLQYKCTLSNAEVVEMLEQGIKKVKTLLGPSAKSFGPLQKINQLSAQTFFGKMAKGYKDIEDKKKTAEKLEKQRNDLKVKASKYRAKGKYDKVKETEYKLFCLEFPNENLEKIEDSMETLEIKFAQGAIDEFEYKSILKDLNRSKKLSEEVLKSMTSLVDTDNMGFYNSVQEDVRNFLCYTFFNKYGSTIDTPNKYLANYLGDVSIDFEHMLLLYNYLKSVKYERIKEIEGVLWYTALEQFYRDISPFLLNRINGIYLKQSPTEFYSEKYEGYVRRYFPFYISPVGYRTFIFEPNGLLHQSFIAAIDGEDLTVDSMVLKYQSAQSFMKNKKDGLFYSFLNVELENRLMKKIVTGDFPLDEMDGELKELLLNEFWDRRSVFGSSDSFDVMTDMYSRVVKPYALEVLGSYVRTFCYNLANLKDKGMICIYYVSPERIAIAVRDDVTDEMMNEVFPKKFISHLKKVEKPILKDIVYGEYV